MMTSTPRAGRPDGVPAGPADRRPGVALTGWLCAGGGIVLVLSGATFGMVGVLARALAQQGTDVLAQARQGMDPLSAALLDHFGAVAVVLVLIGVTSLVIGVQFARLRPAARPAMELLAWTVLAGTVVLQAATLALIQRSEPSPAPSSWLSHPLTSSVLSLLQVAVCLGIIRFVRSAGVRAVFRAGGGKS
jgi:hypothetical protein